MKPATSKPTTSTNSSKAKAAARVDSKPCGVGLPSKMLAVLTAPNYHTLWTAAPCAGGPYIPRRFDTPRSFDGEVRCEPEPNVVALLYFS